jgi:hypothetical protein
MAAESSRSGINVAGGRFAPLPSMSRMHFVPERLVIQETPPKTDEEWDVALELYVLSPRLAALPARMGEKH